MIENRTARKHGMLVVNLEGEQKCSLGVNNVKNEERQIKYLQNNPGVARRKGINIW